MNIAAYQSLFDYLFNSVARGLDRESDFFRPFFAQFPVLAKEQAELKNSSRGQIDGKIITKMRFKDSSIRFVFTHVQLIEAEMKISSDVFSGLKAYAKQRYSGTPSLNWEREILGWQETLKADHFDTEVNFTRVIGMGYEILIKRNSYF